MCSLIDDISEDQLFTRDEDLQTSLSRTCKKCDAPGDVILRNKDLYCEKCFTVNINHKFRATLGKSKVLKPNQNILVTLSGGIASNIILDLIYNSITEATHKRLRINPVYLHIIDCTSLSVTNIESIANKLIEQCTQYKQSLYIIYLYEYLHKSENLPHSNTVPVKDNDMENSFIKLFNSIATPTARNDFINKVKQNLFLTYAKKLNCNVVFTGDTTTNLATKTLANLALGRGSQIEHDVGFCDTRDEFVKILRPMKDISSEELQHYVKIKQLNHVHYESINDISLHNLINKFVTSLQTDFQSTITTLCKTAAKIGICDDGKIQSTCAVCQSLIDTHVSESSALKSTKFSKVVSSTGPQSNEILIAAASSEHSKETANCQNNKCTCKPAEFQIKKLDIEKFLCYGCNLTLSEMTCDIPNNIKEAVKSRMSIKQMEDEIKDFLL